MRGACRAPQEEGELGRGKGLVGSAVESSVWPLGAREGLLPQAPEKQKWFQ